MNRVVACISFHLKGAIEVYALEMRTEHLQIRQGESMPSNAHIAVLQANLGDEREF